MRKRIIGIFLTVILVVSMTACQQTKPEGNSSGYCGTVEGVAFELPDLGSRVELHTQQQNDFLAEAKKNNNYDYIAMYAQGTMEASRPIPVSLSWTASGTQPIDGYSVNISKHADMHAPFYTANTEETELAVYNLEIGTVYYWTVTAQVAEENITSGIASFTTSAQGPRNLYIEGITNVRDIGGYKTSDGGKVKQGMIYRSGRMNLSDDPTPTIEITEEGIFWLKNVLGVRSEIDLRGFEEAGQITQSPLGSDVFYAHYPMTYDDHILKGNFPQIAQIFSYLANEEHYPVVIHCNIGTDRTGLLCFLIDGLCGVSEEDLLLDYIYSNFGTIGGSRSTDAILNDYIPLLENAKGDNLREKIYNYLAENGVSTKDMDAVIAIMKEK